MFYSPSLNYYFQDIPTVGPGDLIEMSEEQLAFVKSEFDQGSIVRYEGGQFVTYKRDDRPPDDVLWRVLRDKRSRLLSQSDWTQVSDNQLSSEVRAAWASYRQALRDLPDITVDPASPIWPIKPE